jgi:probable rRNA maturation factor
VTVALRVACARARGYARTLRADADRLLSALGLGRTELSLIMVDDPTIQGLNREFRGADSPTDVLSFSQIEEIGADSSKLGQPVDLPGTILGDVVISIDTALRQASQYRVTPAERLRTLLIHGTLHLIGYDHERSRLDARQMFARERELLKAVSRRGIGRREVSKATQRRPGKRTAR